MKTVLALTWITVCAFGLMFGQDQPEQFGAAQRVQQFKKLRMIEALKLDDETSTHFFTKYNKHEEIVRDINKQRDGFLDELQGMRKTSASDAEMEKVIAHLSALDAKQLDERTRFATDLKTVLTTSQIADLLLFERNFARNVRQMMQEMARERRQGQR
jgi:hypothetical protein